MYTAKELVRIFSEKFPNIVIEKWLPGGRKIQGNKREPGAIRIVATNGKRYMFTYRSENDWTFSSYGYGPIKE